MRRYKSILISCVALAAAGCAGRMPASLGPEAPARAAWLQVLGPAPAPHGAAELCARMPTLCGGAPSDNLAISAETSGASNARSLQVDGAQMFQLLLAQRANQQASVLQLAGSGQEARPPETVRTLDETAWRELVRINGEVNWRIRAATDSEIYGRDEYWALPISAPGARRGRRGDCEDYALEKRARLIAAGWPINALSLAMAQAPGVGLHAVLIAHTDRGDIVLDNLHENPLPLEAAPYTWLSQQTGANLYNWVSVAFDRAQAGVTVAASALAPQRAPVSAEDLFAAMLRQSRARFEEQAQAAFVIRDHVALEPLAGEQDALLGVSVLREPPVKTPSGRKGVKQT